MEPYAGWPRSDGGTVNLGATGLPCDVAQLFVDNCASCHGESPSGGLATLVTRDDLMKPSQVDPSTDYAGRSLIRITAGTMPPGVGVPADQVAALEAWINAGEPASTCDPIVDGGAGTDALDAAASYASGTYWTCGDAGSVLTILGEACTACPGARRSAPPLSIAGTLYPVGHEQDGCSGGIGEQSARPVTRVRSSRGADAVSG